MKHLRLFENTNGKNDLIDAMVEYERICNLIKEFINFENIHDKPVEDIVMYYYEENVAVVGDKYLFVIFGDNDKDHFDDQPGLTINEDYQQKLYDFISNPKIYKSSKKYNL